MESVIALKFIGLPLKQIRAVIAGDMQDRGRTLQLQIFALEEKKRRLEITINTVRTTEATIRPGGKPCVKHIVEVIEMQNDCGWIVQHFSEDTRPPVHDRLARLKPETWTELQQRWNALAKDIQATLHKDPAGAETQALRRRWEDVVRQMTGDDQGFSRCTLIAAAGPSECKTQFCHS